LIGTTKVMLDFLSRDESRSAAAVNNVFVNTMTQKGVVSQLLPLQTIDKDELQSAGTTSTSRIHRNSRTAF